MDNANKKVQDWENLKWEHQQKITLYKKTAEWILMEMIYELKE